MAEVPEFLLDLGLRADADERDVRRAYAIELKTIDQETQPQQFQRLRAAYEVSLAWVRHGREAHAAAVAQAEAQGSDDAAAPEPEQPRQPVTADEPQEQAPSPTASRDENVRQILIALDAGLQQSPPRSAPQAAALLEAFLEDPRLLDMDARVLFEANVAHMLACGWRPGHEHLFEAALMVFEWRTDSARLLRFGQAGQVVDRAIVEQDAQAQQAPAQRDTQLHYLDLLRRTADPGPQALALGMGPVMHAAGNYPTWVRLTTNTEHIDPWREREARIASATIEQQQPATASRNSGSLNASRLIAAFAIFFVGVLAFTALQAFLRWGETRVPVAQPSASTTESLLHRSPYERDKEKVEAGKRWLTETIKAQAPPETRSPAPESDPAALEYLVPPRPVYPPVSRRMGEQGVVMLRLLVDSTGAVTRVDIQTSSGFDRLDAAAIESVRAAKVRPPKALSGPDARASYTAPIRFKLDNGDAPAAAPTAAASAPRPSYGARISAAVRQNILFTQDIQGNPAVEYALDLAPDGTIVGVKLSKASGAPEWDEATLRAIHRTARMPLADDGTVPRKMVLSLRPKVQ